MDTEAAETVLEKGQNKEPIFDFAHCDKVESVTRDKRSRFSAGQHSSGYSSADYSDCCDGAQGISDSEFGTALRYEGDKKAYDASIARHHNVETDASSSSNSESSDDDKDEDEYRVERREERVLRSQPSQQPRLFSPISTLCEDNRFVWSKVLDANEAEGNAEETAEAEFAADGPATVEHTSSGYEIVVRLSSFVFWELI